MLADLLKGDEKVLTDEELCELEKIGTSASQGVGFRILLKALPDSIVVSFDIGGDEGCARVWAQDVCVKSDSYATMQEAKAAHKQMQRKSISLKAIKKDPAAMAKLTDHVFVLLKVETDEGRPDHPYAQWGRQAFADKESAAQSARKLYKKCLWAKDSGSSDGGGDSKGRPQHGRVFRAEECLGFASDDSDCGDCTQDLSKMKDDVVIFDDCTSIRIRQVMLPGVSSAPSSALLSDQKGALVGDWYSKNGRCRILKDPLSGLGYEEQSGDEARLYGILEEVKGADLLWQATLTKLKPGQDPGLTWLGLGCSEVVGGIRVRLLDAGSRETKAQMETQIQGRSDEWEAPVKFVKARVESESDDDDES